MSLLIQIASNYKCSHRDCSFFPLLACSQLTLTAMGRATDASNRSPSLSNQVAGEGSLPPMTNSNSSSKLAHRLFKGWGLIDLPLRVSTEGLLRPRVARAQKIISLHPHSVPGAQDQREHFPPPPSSLVLFSQGQSCCCCGHQSSVGVLPSPALLMNTSAAIADPLLRRAFGRRARPSDPRRTARVRLRSSGLRAPVSRRGSAISRRTVMNIAG